MTRIARLSASSSRPAVLARPAGASLRLGRPGFLALRPHRRRRRARVRGAQPRLRRSPQGQGVRHPRVANPTRTPGRRGALGRRPQRHRCETHRLPGSREVGAGSRGDRRTCPGGRCRGERPDGSISPRLRSPTPSGWATPQTSERSRRSSITRERDRSRSRGRASRKPGRRGPGGCPGFRGGAEPSETLADKAAPGSPPSAGAKAKPRRSEADEFAATGIGDATEFPVQWVAFEAEPSPAARIALRYEFRARARPSRRAAAASRNRETNSLPATARGASSTTTHPIRTGSGARPAGSAVESDRRPLRRRFAFDRARTRPTKSCSTPPGKATRTRSAPSSGGTPRPCTAGWRAPWAKTTRTT